MPASVRLMFTEHRACVGFISSPRKLHLHEAAECDMKPNKGELVLKRYIFQDAGLLSNTYQTTREVCAERIYFEIKTQALILSRAIQPTAGQVVEKRGQ